jgi:hypothetical protein
MIRIRGFVDLLLSTEEEETEDEGTNGDLADAIGFEIDLSEIELDWDGEPLEDSAEAEGRQGSDVDVG